MQLDVAGIFEGMIAGLRATGINDTAIARGAEVSKATICRYGRGEGKCASAEGYIKLSSFYQQRVGQPPTIRTTRR